MATSNWGVKNFFRDLEFDPHPLNYVNMSLISMENGDLEVIPAAAQNQVKPHHDKAGN